MRNSLPRFSKKRLAALNDGSYHKVYGKKKRPPTGEAALLERLIQERGNFSEIGGDELVSRDHGRWHWQLFHVLGKGEYPELRLLEENVLLSTWQEQDAWTNRKYTLKDKPHWRKVFALEERLKKAVRHGDN